MKSGFETLLVVMSDGESGRAPLDAAIQVGRDFQSHLTALHVKADPSLAVPLVGEGISGSMVEEMMNLAEKEAAQSAQNARTVFEEYIGRWHIALADAPPAPDEFSACWREETGGEEDIVARRARLSDLVVVGRPAPSETAPPYGATLNAALFESGRPVLAVPPLPMASIGRRVAIAWNGSAEAARAVAAALPFLSRKGAQVTILCAQEEGTPIDSAGELASYLAWHGIASETKTLAPAHGATGAALLDAAAKAQADLLVMGAYTHSRLRQLILGGVTRHVLGEARIPVLLTH
jgi:nucleotide-binding universal stress UspA family protein